MELSNNKIFRTIPANPANYSEGNYQLYGEVRVETEPDSGTFDKTLGFKLTPNADDEAIFELQDGVADFFPLPDFNPYLITAIEKITDNQVRAQFWTAEAYGDPQVTQSLTLSETFTVLRGGLPKQLNIDFFNTYLPSSKAFLNWHPGKKRVDISQPELLHFYCYDAAITDLTQKVKVYFSDQTDQTVTKSSLSGITEGSIYRIPAGYSQLDLASIDGTKQIVRYETWLEDQDDSIVSEVKTYAVEQITKPFTRYWMFTNSLGMWEIMRAEGKSVGGMSIDRERSTHYLQQGYDRTLGEIRNRVIGSEEAIEVSTGFFGSKEESLWAKEFLLSQKVLQLTTTERIPYNILTNDYRPYQDHDYKWYLRFEAQLAYNNLNHASL